MNIRTSRLVLKQKASSNQKRNSLLRVIAQIIDMIVSLVLSAFAAIFFAWLNGKQKEFERLEDKHK